MSQKACQAAKRVVADLTKNSTVLEVTRGVSPPPPHFTRQLNGVEWGLKKLDFLLPAASVLTVVLPFAVLVCGDGDQVAETLSLKGHLGFGIHRCAFGVIIPVPAQVVAHYHSNCGGGVLRDL